VTTRPDADRPRRIALICGTGTEVGKTWVASKVLEELRSRGRSVAARKPAQSFDVDARGVRMGGATDAEVLGRASGEHPDAVCHPFRSYHRAMAPPMAADALGLPSFTVKELVDELVWPDGPVDVGIVELAGGVLSPQASDGDTTHFIRVLRPDLVVLVADAGLGTINSVRMSLSVLQAATRFEATEVGGTGVATTIPVVAVLDRFDARHDLHRRNLRWLRGEDGFDVLTMPGNVSELADRLHA
jgi:dethiobiotin synthetase